MAQSEREDSDSLARVAIRLGTPADAVGCAVVQRTAWRETYRGLANPSLWLTPPFTELTARWQDWLAQPHPRYVAQEGDTIVGYAYARKAGRSSSVPPVRDHELYQLYVLASHYGQGIGRRLLEAAAPAEIPTQLWVAARNERAIRFYERNGFAKDGARDDGTSFAGIEAIRLLRG